MRAKMFVLAVGLCCATVGNLWAAAAAITAATTVSGGASRFAIPLIGPPIEVGGGKANPLAAWLPVDHVSAPKQAPAREATPFGVKNAKAAGIALVDRATVSSPYTSPEAPVIPAGGTIIYDSLCITNTQSYDVGNGNAWSGTAIFGSVQDLQLADDFTLGETNNVLQVTSDFVTFLGRCPAHGAFIGFYDDAGNTCTPNEASTSEIDGANVNCATFSDTVFGLLGVRVTTSLGSGVPLPAGRWYVCNQPKDHTASGD